MVSDFFIHFVVTVLKHINVKSDFSIKKTPSYNSFHNSYIKYRKENKTRKSYSYTNINITIKNITMSVNTWKYAFIQ